MSSFLGGESFDLSTGKDRELGLLTMQGISKSKSEKRLVYQGGPKRPQSNMQVSRSGSRSRDNSIFDLVNALMEKMEGWRLHK